MKIRTITHKGRTVISIAINKKDSNVKNRFFLFGRQLTWKKEKKKKTTKVERAAYGENRQNGANQRKECHPLQSPRALCRAHP